MFKKLFFSLLLFAGLCFSANFIDQHGKLKVSGSKILDENDSEVVLRGMSLYWYNGPWTGNQPGNQFYTNTVINNLANNWGASVVRAAIGNVTQSQSDALDMAKKVMDWAYSAGIYVIVDNHSHIAHRQGQAASVQSFFTSISNYVKTQRETKPDYNHVLYEIYNEPVCDWDAPNTTNCGTDQRTTWAQIKSFSQPVISAIRANDQDGLIIVGTPYYSSNISAPRNDPLTESYAHNVLYALHFYAGESGHSNYRTTLRAAYCADFPIFVTEWGTSPASGNGEINTSNSNTWISFLEEAKVSHANWSLSNTNETSAALLSGRTNITNNSDLSESGKYVKNIMRLNAGASLADVGLTQTTINCSSNSTSGPDGRIMFGSNGSLANFAYKSGADSVSTARGAALENTSASFDSEYTFIGIEAAGTYLIRFYTASTAGGTISWSGSGISSGQVQIKNTGSLENFEYTEEQLITISEVPETPLYLSFQTESAKSLRALYVYTSGLNNEDSVKYNVTNVIQNLNSNSNYWRYSANAFVFDANFGGGNLAVYNLLGKRVFAYKVSEEGGGISLKNLPSGAYLAVYKHGGEISKKTIYIK